MLQPRGSMNSPTPMVYWARLSCLMPPVTAAIPGDYRNPSRCASCISRLTSSTASLVASQHRLEQVLLECAVGKRSGCHCPLCRSSPLWLCDNFFRDWCVGRTAVDLTVSRASSKHLELYILVADMPKVKGKGSKSKKGSTGGSKKRVASAAFPAENGRDEFFEGSDSDAPSQAEEQEHQVETPAEKRLRLGIVCPPPSQL